MWVKNTSRRPEFLNESLNAVTTCVLEATEIPKTTQAIACCYLQCLGDKTLLLKIFHSLVKEYREIHLGLKMPRTLHLPVSLHSARRFCGAG